MLQPHTGQAQHLPVVAYQVTGKKRCQLGGDKIIQRHRLCKAAVVVRLRLNARKHLQCAGLVVSGGVLHGAAPVSPTYALLRIGKASG